MKPRTKSLILFAAKVLVAATLIGWLVRSGVLDFKALSIFIDRPILLVANLALFTVSVVTGTMRWRVLLGLAGAKIPFARAIQLHMTAVFFNVVIPGNVGGDVVKALYVARDSAPEKRTTILLIVFVERLVGLGALVLVASAVAVLRGPVLWQNEQTRQLAIGVAFLGFCTVVGPVTFVLVLRRAGDRLEKWTTGTTAIAKLAGRLIAAARLLASGPTSLLKALALSMLAHLATIIFFTVLTHVITGVDVPFSSVATVFPLGIITVLLPIAPAGLGVGHVAFDRLFEMIGVHGGATVFNVYLIGLLAPCLLGVFPYIALKRSGALPTETEAAGEPTGGDAPKP
jgi:glycosyltransferase 2 family protein